MTSLDTFINTNTTPKGGAPAQAEYTSKKDTSKKERLRCAEKQQQEHNITDCIDRVTKTKQMVTFL